MRGIVPLLAVRNTTASWQRPWSLVWAVERTFAWLNLLRRLRVRYEKRADIHEAFMALGLHSYLLEVSGDLSSTLLDAAVREDSGLDIEILDQHQVDG